MVSISSWILAARPRTLPLALGATGMGNLLVFKSPDFSFIVFLLSVLTTVELQILSNFANDYGDSIHGADGKNRKGPKRAVQSGEISPSNMKLAIIAFGGISLVSGLILLWVSFHTNWSAFVPVLCIGLLAIAAAYFYTNGKKPYGYLALGDVSVFLFFGLVAVLTTSYLHTLQIHAADFLPAISMGFWSTAVLNLNNMRDIESDHSAGKFTIPIKIGLFHAKVYQTILVIGGIITLILFCVFQKNWYTLGAFPGCFIMMNSLVGIWKTQENSLLDRYLKPQALGTFLAVLGMAILKSFI